LSPDGNGYDDGYGNLSSPEGFPGGAGGNGGNGSRLTLSGRDALPMSREDDDDEDEEGDDEDEVGVGRGGVGRQFGGAARTASGREPIHLRQEEDEEGKAHSDRTVGSGARRYHSGGEDEAKGFAGSDDDDDEEEEAEECTREKFTLVMLLKLKKITSSDLKACSAQFDRLDLNRDGALNATDVALSDAARQAKREARCSRRLEKEKRRRRRQQQQQQGKKPSGFVAGGH